MSDDNKPVIRVTDLQKRFGDNVIHDNLELEVNRGEIYGVVGGSGTGKSVLLRTIIGLNRPSKGDIQLFGKHVSMLSTTEQSELEQRFGVLFQNGALFSSMTILENIAFPLIEHRGLKRSQAEELAALKISLAGLPSQAGSKYPSELSGGMVKRAALARSLAMDPELLFLDEPTAGLDPISAAAFDNLLLTLRDAFGLTVFMVTHDLDTLYTTCDRVAVLSRKRVLIADTIDVVSHNEDQWIQQYFNGPRGRAAQHSSTDQQPVIER